MRDEDWVRRVAEDPVTATTNARQRAMVDFAVKLTRSPAVVEEADVTRLREEGMNDRCIHDLTAIVAYFNFVNRMASGLGIELEPQFRESPGENR